MSLIGILLVGLFFGDLNFHFFPFKGSRIESWKVRLSSSILQRKWKTIIGSNFIVKSKIMKLDLPQRNMFKSNIFAVFSLLFKVKYFFTILKIVKIENTIKLFHPNYQLIFSQVSPWKCHMYEEIKKLQGNSKL